MEDISGYRCQLSIWVVDLVRHTKTRITFGPQYSDWPVWWPDGKSIVFSYGTSSAGESLYRQNADGTGGKEKLLETPGISALPFSVSPDGRYIAYLRRDPKSSTGVDIWALPLFPDNSGEQKPFPVVATNFVDVSPAFSPDGKWLAYSNDETGPPGGLHPALSDRCRTLASLDRRWIKAKLAQGRQRTFLFFC